MSLKIVANFPLFHSNISACKQRQWADANKILREKAHTSHWCIHQNRFFVDPSPRVPSDIDQIIYSFFFLPLSMLCLRYRTCSLFVSLYSLIVPLEDPYSREITCSEEKLKWRCMFPSGAQLIPLLVCSQWASMPQEHHFSFRLLPNVATLSTSSANMEIHLRCLHHRWSVAKCHWYMLRS